MFDMDRWKVLQLVAIFSTLHIISEEIPEPQGNDFLRVDNCAPSTTNFTAYVSPKVLIWGQKATISMEAIIPVKVTGGLLTTTYWYGGFPDPIYKQTKYIYCRNRERTLGAIPPCPYQKGDKIAGINQNVTLLWKHGKTNQMMMRFASGKYRARAEFKNQDGNRYACAELTAYATFP